MWDKLNWLFSILDLKKEHSNTIIKCGFWFISTICQGVGGRGELKWGQTHVINCDASIALIAWRVPSTICWSNMTFILKMILFAFEINQVHYNPLSIALYKYEVSKIWIFYCICTFIHYNGTPMTHTNQRKLHLHAQEIVWKSKLMSTNVRKHCLLCPLSCTHINNL